MASAMNRSRQLSRYETTSLPKGNYLSRRGECAKCMKGGGGVQLGSRRDRSRQKKRVRLPLHCPLPTAHCPLPTAYCLLRLPPATQHRSVLSVQAASAERLHLL